MVYILQNWDTQHDQEKITDGSATKTGKTIKACYIYCAVALEMGTWHWAHKKSSSIKIPPPPPIIQNITVCCHKIMMYMVHWHDYCITILNSTYHNTLWPWLVEFELYIYFLNNNWKKMMTHLTAALSAKRCLTIWRSWLQLKGMILHVPTWSTVTRSIMTQLNPKICIKCCLDVVSPSPSQCFPEIYKWWNRLNYHDQLV